MLPKEVMHPRAQVNLRHGELSQDAYYWHYSSAHTSLVHHTQHSNENDYQFKKEAPHLFAAY